MTLDGSSSLLAHKLQNIALLSLSLLFLPVDTLILVATLISRLILYDEVERHRKQARCKTGFRRRNVLITGVGMTKGLVLARLFYEAGHDVFGADFEPNGALVCGRGSRSLERFFRLRQPDARNGSSPYIQSLLDIITREKIELWVSCSGVASAVEDGIAKEIIEARTPCKAIQFDVKTTQMLHEKHTFIEHTRDIGLTVPETHEITTRAMVERILHHAPPGRKYILKTIGVDDSVRGDMTLLPTNSGAETSKHLATLDISRATPWILQQFIRGKEYCTHSVVVRGRVRAFVACPSAELLMHYQALPVDSDLTQAMLGFTQRYAAEGGPGFSGHLSFDFMVEDTSPDNGNIVLYPIECNPRAHTAVALFNGTPAMVEGYLSVLEGAPASESKAIVTPSRNDKYYWAGHDLITRAVLPIGGFLTLRLSLADLIRSYASWASHLVSWRDGTYEWWDPLPWWWLYHVYWPMRLMSCILEGRKWSRLNVSTTKVFEC